jgi:PAS domain S-box-containing protein
MSSPHASATAHHQDALFRLLIERVEDYAIFMMDGGGHIQTWNEGAQRITGYTASEIIGTHHSIFYPPAELRRGKPAYVLAAATDEGKFEEEHWRVRKSGDRFWASVVITALRSPSGELFGFAKVIRDLTERKQAEEDRNTLLALERGARTHAERLLDELRAMQSLTEAALANLNLDDLLRSILDRLSELLEVDTVAVLLLTEDTRWLVPRAAKGLEEEVEAGIRLPLGHGFAGRIAAERRPIVLDDVEHSDVLNPILRQKGIRSLLGVPLLVGGEPLGVLHVGSLHTRHFTDEEVRFLQIAADRVALAIDHARLYEAAERASRAAEAAGDAVRQRDEFLSVAAHELRTPITGLRTAAQVILRAFRRNTAMPEDRLLRMVTVIDQESEKLARLVSQLLDLSRLEAGKLALEFNEVDIAALVRGVVDRMQVAASAVPIRVAAPEVLMISVDALRMEQVLTNLIDNAMKFSPDGGGITVACSHAAPHMVELSVRDHGIGLPPSEREQIFERFYQVNASERSTGLGLGLYVTREIVERHGGRIWAETPPDGGDRFVIQIPARVHDPC